MSKKNIRAAAHAAMLRAIQASPGAVYNCRCVVVPAIGNVQGPPDRNVVNGVTFNKLMAELLGRGDSEGTL